MKISAFSTFKKEIVSTETIRGNTVYICDLPLFCHHDDRYCHQNYYVFFLINMVMLPRTLTLYPGLLPKSGLPRATSQENCVWVSKRDKTKEKATQNAERGFRFWFWIFTFNTYCILLIFSLLFVWYGFRFFCHLVFLHGGSCRNPQYLSEMWGNFWCDLCNVGAESAPLVGIGLGYLKI